MMVTIPLILGLAIGSFLNAAEYRLKNGRPFVFGRSFCPSCKHQLSWWELMPVLSFLWLRRRCHSCQAKISWQYPMVEIITALVFAGVFLVHSHLNPLVLGLLLITSGLLVFIALYDAKYYLILDGSVIMGIVLALLFVILSSGNLGVHVLSGLGLTALFGGIFYISKGQWIGFGDVKLAFFLGLLLGPWVIVAVFLASWLGTLVGLYLILRQKAHLKTQLPFGTFLSLGTIIVLILYPHLEAYLALWL